MNIPEEFGKYLLLKKLTEDPLGETFRAGRVGQEGMEQVVLLRVFNGKGLDGETLWARASGRAGVQEILKSPNIGNGVDLGRVRSFPYTAYDYISGKSLASVFAQSARQRSPVPTDHALLIAERISLALAAAFESRFQDERVMHGFVVPQLVMISNEGETRLLGFEVAPGLRELAAGGWQDEAVRPYLAPEALAGAAPSRADDVYSLGALLFELLTGRRLPAGPAAPAEGYGALIDGAELLNDGTPMPAPIAALLKASLAGREQRIADAVTWHKTLSKLMIDGHFSPTTFNLAFFMHNLFRDDIERESQEMQAEKRLELPKRQPAPAPVAVAAAAAAPLREGTGVREGTLSGTFAGTRSQAAPEPSRKGLWMGIAAVLAVAVLAGGGYFAFVRSAATTPVGGPAPGAAPTPRTAAMPGTTPAPGAVPAAAGPSEEQLNAQIQQMFDARSKEMEAKLKNQYDDRIKQLQKQLEDTRKGNVERPQTAAVPAAPEPRPAPRNEPPPPAPVQEKPAVAVPTPAPAERPAAVPTPAPASPAPANPAPTAPARQAQVQVQVGDLVQPGPGVAPPKLQGQLDPRYPFAAQRLNRAAQVDIKVLVDERGRVLDAERLGAKAGFGFDEAALEAARRATFQPASKDGVKVKMWMMLRVNFSPPVH
ncbi:MAG TPA: TonB family protein [Thermoanaerobaculia bacterium]|jgi:TonB family protein|nr:TonB family protein [Thermoanaerobaculia bacterium]